MSLTRREQLRDATRQEIKTHARQQMADGGTGAISLRGIARQMGMTAPALYRYFENRDALITALIVDAFDALAEFIEQAWRENRDQSSSKQLAAVMLAYREWALMQRTEFQLIYGTPIPGYVAPVDITMPAARRAFIVFIRLIGALVAGGNWQPTPPYRQVPPELAEHLQMLVERDGYRVPLEVLYLGVCGWSHIHGMIMLEINNHLPPVVGDTEAFYRAQINNLFIAQGVPLEEINHE